MTFLILPIAMLSHTPKSFSLSLSTPFLAVDHRLPRRQSPPPHSHPKSTSISAIIIPPSSSPARPQQQQIYQPYRPPPSPVPTKYRSLDTSARLDILTDRLGAWFEYAPLITSLYREGFISTTLEEITGISSLEQNRLVVASQVRDSLVECCDSDTVSFFDNPGSPEILYEIRILNTPQRASSAKFIIKYSFDGRRAGELAKSIKDFPRRYAEKGWESFDGNLPGDCLGFMYYRQAHEHKSASLLELSRATFEKALEVSESELAKQRVSVDLEEKDVVEGDVVAVEEIVRVPVVRMSVGEVAQSSIVVVLPVCKAEGKGKEVEEAPWECGTVGDFGVVEAEKGWNRWVVLPGWEPVAVLKRGGVAVAFKRAGDALLWTGKRRDAEEQILVVADRGRREVALDGAFYLVVSGGNNGSGEERLRVESGLKLKEIGVGESLGTVVLIVRPPRDDYEDQPDPQDWE